jgi:hypothetical protein
VYFGVGKRSWRITERKLFQVKRTKYYPAAGALVVAKPSVSSMINPESSISTASAQAIDRHLEKYYPKTSIPWERPLSNP